MRIGRLTLLPLRFALFTFGYFLVTFWLLLSLLFLAFSLTLCNSNRGHFNSHFCFNFQRCFETFASARPRNNAGDGAGNSSSRSPFLAPSVIPFSLLYPSSGFTLLLLLFLALDKCFSGICVKLIYLTRFYFNNFDFTLILLLFIALFRLDSCCLFLLISY